MEKLAKLVQADGFCCLWAFLEAYKQAKTPELVMLARQAGFKMTARTIRQHRREYRRRKLACLGAANCLLLGRRSSPECPRTSDETCD